MINIAHPRVCSKPPLSGFGGCRAIEKKKKRRPVVETRKESAKILDNNRSVESSALSDSGNVLDREKSCPEVREDDGDAKKKFEREDSTNDRDRNVIEPDSSSFRQLCSMINDLEQNMSTEATGIVRDDGNDPKNCLKFGGNSIDDLSPKYFDQPEKDDSRNVCMSNGSTYEDIMSFLGTLEHNNEIPEFSGSNDCYGKPDSKKLFPHGESLRADLSTALLQLEDREATIKVLKNELKSERKIACEKFDRMRNENSTELETESTKYQTVIKRHQKFIEQLLTEKKDLTEKCNALAQRIKESETKQQRELKCILDRHAVELQRARDMCAASEKIRRERWLEAKTSKIKEMTVKGMEPELRSMIEHHQQEIQDIRSSHMKELQDVELRSIRRSNQQLEQLRLELTASHDKIVSNEREALRIRFQEKFDEQETLVQAQHRKFFEELQLERKRFAEEQARRDADRDLTIKQSSSQFQEKMEMLVRQHQIDKRTLEETLQAEREVWMENYRRQQTSKYDIAQTRIMDDCNRERDRQIELAISALETEKQNIKVNLEKAWENKLRCTTEKYECEIQEANEQMGLLKNKLTNAQQKLEEQERQTEKIEERLRQCGNDFNEAKQKMDRLTLERDQAKRIARQDIESEKRDLEEKIASLYRELTENNANRDSVMAQLYSRIKLIVTQKDLAMKNASRETHELREKCEHLEKLLDQQRKEYVLKSL